MRLSDGDNVCSVRVIGRRSPGILPTHDLLDAEVTPGPAPVPPFPSRWTRDG
ncbi:hypothetical protein ABZZ80_12830 [Streptomyces sp. NPDC006356]